MRQFQREHCKCGWQWAAISPADGLCGSRRAVFVCLLVVLGIAPAWMNLSADELSGKDATSTKGSPSKGGSSTKERDSSSAARYTDDWLARLDKSAEDIQQWANRVAWQDAADKPDIVIDNITKLLAAKDQADKRLAALWDERTRYASLPATDARRREIRGYLTATSRLIELSGRLRYSLRDALDNASFDLSPHPTHVDRMIDVVVTNRSQIGAVALTYALFDPPAEEGIEPFSPALKTRILKLIADARPPEALDDLAEFVRLPKVPPELLVLAAEAISRIGLPQDARPNQDPELPKPAITASQLHERLSALDTSALSDDGRKKHTELLAWLDQQRYRGITDPALRVAGIDVAPGDWLLMRNPSPYNLFTDHSPGLFTHVGVVAEERDRDGRRRLVIVDLPERGSSIPATNVDVFLRRTLHYVFLRHRDAKVAQAMGTAAASIIGNPSQFDLQFRSDRVREMKGRSLAGATIHTYCAGLLMLCAQQSSQPIESFFPIVEQPAGGRCPKNLAQLGLSIGKDFVSPTGALFSTELQIVGRCEPMYEPTREVQERVFDAFAKGMIERQLSPTPNAYQALRERVASMSKRNRALARALAKANNVSENLDLESAAKAAAVVETLDEIAEGSAAEFEQARDALLAPPDEQLVAPDFTAEQVAGIRRLRQKHAKLYADLRNDRVTPAQMREALVEYYGRQGVQRLNERFFP